MCSKNFLNKYIHRYLHNKYVPKLYKYFNCSDQLIRDSIPSEDPLILQPASLEIVTVKKRPGEDDFGLEIDPVHHPGVHVIHNVKWDSLAGKYPKILEIFF